MNGTKGELRKALEVYIRHVTCWANGAGTEPNAPVEIHLQEADFMLREESGALMVLYERLSGMVNTVLIKGKPDGKGLDASVDQALERQPGDFISSLEEVRFVVSNRAGHSYIELVLRVVNKLSMTYNGSITNLYFIFRVAVGIKLLQKPSRVGIPDLLRLL